MNIELDLDPWQQAIVEAPHKVKCAIVGRRAGKTTFMLAYAGLESQRYDGVKCWYCAPTYARCKSAMKAMETSSGFMQFVRRSYAQFPMRYEMKNGSSIEFRSLDKGHFKNAKGEGLKFCAFDEAALLDAEAYYEVIRPMLLDTNGTIVLGSTYRGRNWLYHLAQKGLEINDRIKTWVLPSSVGRRFQGPDGKARLEQFKLECADKPGYWEQECMCIPISGTDAAWRYVSRTELDETPDQALQRTYPRAGQRYAVSIDIGREPDFGFLLVLEVATGLVVFAEQLPQVDHSIQAAKCREIFDRYKACFSIIDATGGGGGGHDSHVKEYRKVLPGLREWIWTRDNKRLLVGQLGLEMEQRKLQIPKTHSELLSQLKAYKYKMSDFGLYPTFGAPKGEHDDGCAALMQVVWARSQNWIPSSGFGPASNAFG